MKSKHSKRIVAIVVVSSLVIYVLGICTFLLFIQIRNPHRRVGKVLYGTNLVLRGEIAGFRVFLSKNKTDGYLLAKGDENLYLRLKTSQSGHEITYFHKGLPILNTVFDIKGHPTRCTLSFYDNKGDFIYCYIDQDGDGLWDTFIDFKLRRKYFRSGMKWLPFGEKEPQENDHLLEQGIPGK